MFINKKQYEYFIKIEDKNGEVVIETDSNKSLKKVYKWLGYLNCYNQHYSFYVIKHLKNKRYMIKEKNLINILFLKDGNINVYNDTCEFLLCQITGVTK